MRVFIIQNIASSSTYVRYCEESGAFYSSIEYTVSQLANDKYTKTE